MPVTDQLSGRTVTIDGKELLYFSGTAYLGINKNSEFQEYLLEGMHRYGSNYSSSRASNLQLAIYEEVEKVLASLTTAAAALTFSSGYLAGQAVIRTLNQRRTFTYAPGAHPALWRNRKDGYYGNYKSWALALPARVAAIKEKETVIVSNSLDPLLAEKYQFDWIDHLSTHKSVTLLIDDSHGFGIIGNKGAGIYSEIKARLKPNITLVVISSFGKAFGIPGGVVLGEASFIEALKKSPFFTAGSPVPPAYLYAFMHAQPIYERARRQLTTNVKYFQQLIKPTRLFRYFDTYPVFYTMENNLYEALREHCLLSSFSYPDPESTPITRVVINSLHRNKDIEFLVEQINAFGHLHMGHKK